MNHYYMPAVGTPEAIQKMTEADRRKGFVYTIHVHYEGEPCVDECEVVVWENSAGNE